MADWFPCSCNFDGQAGEELRDAHTRLSPKAEGREMPGSRGLGGGAVVPKPTCYDQDSSAL